VKKLKVYWNNICLLRKGEEAFINAHIAENPDTEFCVEYFGLGLPKKLRGQIAADLERIGEPDADVIVSTELDIFWDKRLLNGRDFFAPIAGSFDVCPLIKDAPFTDPAKTLAVCQCLPMPVCVNEGALKAAGLREPTSLKDLCAPEFKGKTVLGGADTAAGRIVAASINYLYGAAATEAFLSNAAFASIPAAALSAAARGAYPVCVLPSVLCGRGLKTVFPSDGVPAIPTYAAVKKTAPAAESAKFLDMLFSRPMQEFYSDRGLVISGRADVPPPSAMYGAAPYKPLYPDWDWLNNRFDAAGFSARMDRIKPF
jgi:hypothetical protein